jgi:hypothetical protein
MEQTFKERVTAASFLGRALVSSGIDSQLAYAIAPEIVGEFEETAAPPDDALGFIVSRWVIKADLLELLSFATTAFIAASSAVNNPVSLAALIPFCVNTLRLIKRLRNARALEDDRLLTVLVAVKSHPGQTAAALQELLNHNLALQKRGALRFNSVAEVEEALAQLQKVKLGDSVQALIGAEQGRYYVTDGV